jgi:hypothetical protein
MESITFCKSDRLPSLEPVSGVPVVSTNPSRYPYHLPISCNAWVQPKLWAQVEYVVVVRGLTVGVVSC